MRNTTFLMLFILWLISVPGITPHKLLNKPAHFWISVAMNCEYRNPSKISAFLTFIAWLCPKAIKTYWPKIGIFPMHHHRIHCHFLIVFKTLASRSLCLLPHRFLKPGVEFHRTWQRLFQSLLLLKCMLLWGFQIRRDMPLMRETFEQFSFSMLYGSQTTVL